MLELQKVTKLPEPVTLFTLGFKMRLEQSDHKWTALNTSVNHHQDAFDLHTGQHVSNASCRFLQVTNDFFLLISTAGIACTHI